MTQASARRGGKSESWLQLAQLKYGISWLAAAASGQLGGGWQLGAGESRGAES